MEGWLAEDLTAEPDLQAGGECKVQGRKAIEKPGLSRVHIWEVETLASNHNNCNSQGKQLGGLSVICLLRAQTPTRHLCG